MKKILLISIIGICFIACSDINSFNSGKQVEDFVQKIEQNPDLDVCTEGIPLLTNIINGNNYQKNVLQIIESLAKIPQIKECNKYDEIAAILNMAQGYQNVRWEASIKEVQSVFGKIRLIPDNYYNESEVDKRSKVLTILPKEAFFWANAYHDEDAKKWTAQGLFSPHSVPMYGQGEKTFLFYKNKFFAYYERLPVSDDKNLYLHQLQSRYGKNTSRHEIGDFGIKTDRMIHTWTFGNTYIVLYDVYGYNTVIYVDKKILDELNAHYEATQKKLKEQENELREQRERHAQSVSNRL